MADGVPHSIALCAIEWGRDAASPTTPPLDPDPNLGTAVTFTRIFETQSSRKPAHVPTVGKVVR